MNIWRVFLQLSNLYYIVTGAQVQYQVMQWAGGTHFPGVSDLADAPSMMAPFYATFMLGVPLVYYWIEMISLNVFMLSMLVSSTLARDAVTEVICDLHSANPLEKVLRCGAIFSVKCIELF